MEEIRQCDRASIRGNALKRDAVRCWDHSRHSHQSLIKTRTYRQRFIRLFFAAQLPPRRLTVYCTHPDQQIEDDRRQTDLSYYMNSVADALSGNAYILPDKSIMHTLT